MNPTAKRHRARVKELETEVAQLRAEVELLKQELEGFRISSMVLSRMVTGPLHVKRETILTIES